MRSDSKIKGESIKRFMVIIMAMAMIITMMPTMTFADESISLPVSLAEGTGKAIELTKTDMKSFRQGEIDVPISGNVYLASIPSVNNIPETIIAKTTNENAKYLLNIARQGETLTSGECSISDISKYLKDDTINFDSETMKKYGFDDVNARYYCFYFTGSRAPKPFKDKMSDVIVIKVAVKPANYELTLSSSDESKGTVKKEHIDGDTWRISAEPEREYGFDGWSDGNKEANRIVTLTGKTDYIANFGNIKINICDEGYYNLSRNYGAEDNNFTNDNLIGGNKEIPNINLFVGMNGGVFVNFTTTGSYGNTSMSVKLYDINEKLVGSLKSTYTQPISAFDLKGQLVRLTDGLKALPEGKVKVVMTIGEGENIASAEKIVVIKNELKQGEQANGIRLWSSPVITGLKPTAIATDQLAIYDTLSFPDNTVGAKIYLACSTGIFEKKTGQKTDIIKMEGDFPPGMGYGRFSKMLTITGTDKNNMASLYYYDMNTISVYTYDSKTNKWSAEDKNFLMKDGCLLLEGNGDLNAAWSVGDEIYAVVGRDTFKWNKQGWIKYQSMPDGAISNSAYRLNSTTAYVGTDKGLYKYTTENNGTWEKIDVSSTIPGSTLHVLNGTQNGHLYVTTDVSPMAGENINSFCNGAKSNSIIYQVDVKNNRIKAIEKIESCNDSVWTVGEDYKGEIYGMVSGYRRFSGDAEHYATYLYKIKSDGNWTYLSNKYLNKNEADGKATYGDNICKILNPIDKLTIFSGGLGTHLAMDDTAYYISSDPNTFKASAKTQLQIAFGKLDKAWYNENEWDQVIKAKNEGDKNIEAANDAVAAINALNNAIDKMMAVNASNMKDRTVTVAVSMEKFTLGQGYIIEPTLVTIPAKQLCSKTITDLIKKQFPNMAQPWRMTGTVDTGFYLASVYQNEEGIINIPDYIRKAPGIKGGVSTTKRGDPNWLGEFDYSSDSGWMYAINSSFPGVGASGATLENGDVMRWQFTLVGYGSDLNADNSEWGTKPLKILANKDSLTYRVAEINSMNMADKQAYLKTYQKAYDKAYKVLTTIDSSQSEVNEALAALKKDSSAEAAVESSAIVNIIAKTDNEGKAKASVTSTTVVETLKKAMQTINDKPTPGATNIIPVVELNIKPDKLAKELLTIIDKEGFEKIADSNKAVLRIVTNNGTIELNNDSIKEIVKQAEGKKITISILKDKATDKQQKLLGDNVYLTNVSVMSADKEIHSFGNGNVTLYLPENIHLKEKNVAVFYINDKDMIEKLKSEKVKIGENNYYKVYTNHFSAYGIAEESYIDEAIKKQGEEKNVKIIKGVKNTKITFKSIKSKKGNITLKWKKTKGYKMDGYQVYKSVGKARNFKEVWKTKKLKYKNSKDIKNNRKYYYKVRGFRNIDGKLYYSKWSKPKYVIAK